jgi:hypothetical protein
MSTPRPSRRPRFEVHSKHAPEEVARRVREHLKNATGLRGLALKDRIELGIAGDDLRFWSPQLVAEVVADGEGGAHLRARFGPDPYIWAMYLLAYAALVLVTLLALCFGVAQWSMGNAPTALFAAPGAAVLAGLVYGVSFVGQGLGSDQMYVLRSTLTKLAEADEDL